MSSYKLINEPSSFNPKEKDLLTKFLDFCFQALKLNDTREVSIFFAAKRQDDSELVTTAYYNDQVSKIDVYSEGRAFVDICRSLGHELTHKAQFDKDLVKNPKAVYQGHKDQGLEDQANAEAGRLIREFGEQHPEIYDEGQLNKDIPHDIAPNAEVTSMTEMLQKLTGKKVILK